MPKNQNQLTGLIENNLYAPYQQWKNAQGFTNDSIALNYLLADFFGIEYPINRFEVNQRLEILEKQLVNLTQQVESLTKVLTQDSKVETALDQLVEVTPNQSKTEVKASETKKTRQKKTTPATVKTETIKNEKVKTEKKSSQPLQPKESSNSYQEMTKKELFALLTDRKISHRIAPKDRLKRKEEMIADLLAYDQQIYSNPI